MAALKTLDENPPDTEPIVIFTATYGLAREWTGRRQAGAVRKQARSYRRYEMASVIPITSNDAYGFTFACFSVKIRGASAGWTWVIV